MKIIGKLTLTQKKDVTIEREANARSDYICIGDKLCAVIHELPGHRKINVKELRANK